MLTPILQPPMPTFTAFYRALNDRDPFPWQAHLANQIAVTESWPAEIGVPTGLGKTACLDVAVWWLASQADRVPALRRAPIRIWWVVNRRLLVDATAEHATAVSQVLQAAVESQRDDSGGVVLAVATRLKALAADPSGDILEVIRLRGGIASRTPRDPSKPAVILCTLPMFGSRLLFRGYGSRNLSIDAAMAGTDSLILLDEAHLAPHLFSLIPALQKCAPAKRTVLCEPRSNPKIVALTATGNPDETERFDLGLADKSHPIVRQRLDAPKPLGLRIVSKPETAKQLGRHLADAAINLITAAPRPTSCLVFANTPTTARAVFDRLTKVIPHDSGEVLLLTGLSRERESEKTRARILDPIDGMASERDEQVPRSRHFVVVATQTLEVGADIDAECLVTESCGVRALTQRLGRLNRLGRFAHAKGTYVHLPPSRSKRGSGLWDWPVYGTEPSSVLERLKDIQSGDPAGVVNLSPRNVAKALGPPMDSPQRAPEILYGLLWEWMKTTKLPAGAAPVEPYFAGIADVEYRVSVIWRAHIPEQSGQLWPRARARETVDIPDYEARDEFSSEKVHRLSADGLTMETCRGQDLCPRDRIIVPIDRGLLDEFGWNRNSGSTVEDVSLRGRGLPLDSAAIERLCGISVDPLLIETALGNAYDDEDIDVDERNNALIQLLQEVRASTPAGWTGEEWNDFVSSLNGEIVTPLNEVPRLTVRAEVRQTGLRSDEHDERSRAETAIDLQEHCRAVAARARSIARSLGVASELVEVVERAGKLHDIGKADARFQRWLDPRGIQDRLVAKSDTPRHRWERTRVAAGWPRGGRHEALSSRLIKRWMDLHPHSYPNDMMLRDLLLHLVLSHHGKGRPLVPPVSDGTFASVAVSVEGEIIEVAADLGIADWEQPTRFRRLCDQFGPWGLALLEGIVVKADHAVSAGAAVDVSEVDL